MEVARPTNGSPQFQGWQHRINPVEEKRLRNEKFTYRWSIDFSLRSEHSVTQFLSERRRKRIGQNYKPRLKFRFRLQIYKNGRLKKCINYIICRRYFLEINMKDLKVFSTITATKNLQLSFQ